MYSHVKYPSFLKIELIRKENEKIFCIIAVFSKKITPKKAKNSRMMLLF